ncbi:MAG: aryl-sulfate sulfotransferase [Pseudomonadota bacterium]
MPGYTLFTPATTTYLIDMEGDIAKTWQWELGGDTQLLENGHLLRLEVLPFPARPSGLNWGGASGMVSEYTWDGKLVWQHAINSADEISHHMIHRMPNGNTLVIVWERITYADAVQRGRDPQTLNNAADPAVDCYDSVDPPGRYKCDFWPDKIVELDRKGVPTGWEWRAWDHVCNAQEAGCIDINYRFPITPRSHRSTADYMHANSIDFDPETETILLNSRVFGEFFIIDYHTGEIVDRWGNPCAYGAGTCPSYMNDGDQRLFGPHASHFVRAPSAGAGNVLIFNNGWMQPTGSASDALEVVRNAATGRFSDGDVTWQFATVTPTYSEFAGYAQELPNDNRLITMSMDGHLIEVNRESGEIVWEFVSPVVGAELFCYLTEEQAQANFMFRALRYAADYPGLKGRKLQRGKRFDPRCPPVWSSKTDDG